MIIFLNGDEHTLADNTLTVADLLAALGITGQRIAVEINGEIAPRSQHAHTILNTHDKVEVVHAIGGG